MPLRAERVTLEKPAGGLVIAGLGDIRAVNASRDHYVGMGVAAKRRIEPNLIPRNPLKKGQATGPTLELGISGGTDHTYFDGTNIYQLARWDPERGRFVALQTPQIETPTVGYMSVAQIEESWREDMPEGLIVAAKYGSASGHTFEQGDYFVPLPQDIDPLLGIYVAQFGVVAANAVAKLGTFEGGRPRNPGEPFGKGVEDKSVFLLGGGGIGITTALLLRRAGVSDIVIADAKQERVDFLRSQGFNAILSDTQDVEGTLDKIQDHYGQRGADIMLDTTGSSSGLRMLNALAPIGSTVYTMSYFPGGGQIDANAHRKNLTLKSIQVQEDPPGYTRDEETEAVIDMLRDPRDGAVIRKMTNHRVPLSEMQKAMEALDPPTLDNLHPERVIDQYRVDPDVPLIQIAMEPDHDRLEILLRRKIARDLGRTGEVVVLRSREQREKEQPKVLEMAGGYAAVVVDGSLTVLNAEGEPIMTDAEGHIELNDGRTLSTREGNRTVRETDDGGVRIEVAFDDGLPTVSWEITPAHNLVRPDTETATPALRIKQEVGETDIGVKRFVPFSVAGDAPIDKVTATDFGYQSWSPARIGTLSKMERIVDTMRLATIEPIAENTLTFSFFTHLQTDEGSVLAGSTSTKDMHTTIEAGKNRTKGHVVKLWNPTEGTTKTASEDVLLIFDTPREVAAKLYTQDIARQRGIEINPDMPRVLRSTWYEDRQDISEDYVRTELPLVKEFEGADGFIIDDGWQSGLVPGDWVPNDKFRPSHLRGLSTAELLANPDAMKQIDAHMRQLATDMREQGIEPFLWSAVTTAHGDSEFVKNHPEALVKDEHGQPKPMPFDDDWKLNGTEPGKKSYVVDVTHPVGRAKIEADLERIYHTWGFSAKYDFLFGAYIEGVHHDPEVTSMQAGNMVMELIKQKAKEKPDYERFVLGCSGPLIASAGYVDAQRTDNDSSPKWENGPRKGEKRRIIASLHRGYWAENLFVANPDPPILRINRSELTPPQRTASMVATVLTDGIIEIGDNLHRMLGEDQLRYHKVRHLFGKMTPPAGISARPVTYDEQNDPQQMRLDMQDGERKWIVAADFNMGTMGRQSVLQPENYDLEPDAYYDVFDMVREAHLGTYRGNEPMPLITLDAGGANLVTIMKRGKQFIMPSYEDFLGRNVVEGDEMPNLHETNGSGGIPVYERLHAVL